MPIGIGKPLAAAFGKSNEAPKPVFLPGTGGMTNILGNLGKDALQSLRTGGAAAERGYNEGTGLQRNLVDEQAGIVRNIIARRLGASPEDTLRSVGNTAFSFINPNVVDPLSRFDVNSDRLMRSARGLNPAAVDSTAQRLRDARIASGRYYDTARQVYGQLPQLFNQVFNAGLSNDEMASSYIPNLAGQYRALDTAPLEAARLRSGAANSGATNFQNIANAIRSGVYGYVQPTNWADKLGDVDMAMRDSLQDAINMAAQVYGMVGGGGAGGMMGGMGGMMGGMGGGASTASPEAAPQPRFIPMTDRYPGTTAGIY